MVVEPCEDGEEDGSDERVAALLDEEAHRVALAEGGRGRGRAEDHHEPERDEAQRDEDEHPLLELSLHQTQLQHEPAERLSARLEVVELVEARAGRREEDDLSRHGGRTRLANGGGEVAAVQVGNVRCVERTGDLRSSVTDQVGAVAELEVCCQVAVALAACRARPGSRAGVCRGRRRAHGVPRPRSSPSSR